MEKIKCPWCGRTVGFSKSGNIEPHVQSNKVKCVGVGQPRVQVLAHIELRKEIMDAYYEVIISGVINKVPNRQAAIRLIKEIIEYGELDEVRKVRKSDGSLQAKWYVADFVKYRWRT